MSSQDCNDLSSSDFFAFARFAGAPIDQAEWESLEPEARAQIALMRRLRAFDLGDSEPVSVFRTGGRE
jgi:hypothetical protein